MTRSLLYGPRQQGAATGLRSSAQQRRQRVRQRAGLETLLYQRWAQATPIARQLGVDQPWGEGWIGAGAITLCDQDNSRQVMLAVGLLWDNRRQRPQLALLEREICAIQDWTLRVTPCSDPEQLVERLQARADAWVAKGLSQQSLAGEQIYDAEVLLRWLAGV